jgi:uncharacterized YccA/Bax inhibitor family protein
MEPVFVSHHGPNLVFTAVLTAFLVFIAMIVIAIKVLIFCKIFSKAGYSWALGLLLLVPIANIIMAFFLAFADWPIRKELRRLKQQSASGGQVAPPTRVGG